MRKSAQEHKKEFDELRRLGHIREGSKRFEEQQASGNVADRER